MICLCADASEPALPALNSLNFELNQQIIRKNEQLNAQTSNTNHTSYSTKKWLQQKKVYVLERLQML